MSKGLIPKRRTVHFRNKQERLLCRGAKDIISSWFDESRRGNEFAEWHVGWLAE